MASLGTLTADLILQIAQWTGPLDKAEQDLLDFHKNVQRTVNDITGEFVKFASETALAIGGVSAIIEDFKAAMDWGKSIELLARQTGLETEALDQLALTAKLSDVSTDKLAQTLDKLSKSMVAARNPANELNAVFAALKVDPSGNPADVLLKTVAAINAIPDPALRAATAIAVLGKGGAEVAVRMAAMAEDSARAAEAIAAFGKVTDEQAAASKSLSDSLTLIQEGAKRIVGPIITELAPAFDAVVRAMEAMVGASSNVAASIGTGLALAIRIIAALLVDLVSGIEVVVVAIADFAKTLDALASRDWKGAFKAAHDALTDLGAIARGTAAAHEALLTPAIENAGKAANDAAPDQYALSDAIEKLGSTAKTAADDLAKYLDKAATAATAKQAGVSPETVKALDALNTTYQTTNMSVGEYNALQEKIIANDSVMTSEQNKLTEAATHYAETISTLKQKWEDALSAQAGGVSPQTVKALSELDRILAATGGHWKDYAAAVALAKSQDPVSAAQVKSIAEADAAIAKMTDDITDLTQSYGDQIAALSKTDVEREQAIAQQKIQNALEKALLDIRKDYANDPARMAAATKEVQANADAAKQLAPTWAAALVQEKAYYAIVNTQDAANKQLADEVQLLGLEGIARDQKLAQLREEQALSLASTGAEKEHAAAVFATTQGYLAQKAAFDQYQQSVNAWSQVFKTIDDYGQKFFDAMSHGLSGIKDWAKQAGDALKQYLEQVLYELTVRPFVVNIVQQVSGAFGANTGAVGAGANLAGQGGALAGLASLFGGSSQFSNAPAPGETGPPSALAGLGQAGSAASSVGSLAGLFGAGGGAFAAAAGSSMAASAATLGIAAEAGTAAVGGMAAVAGSLVAFVPVVGAILAVGYLAYTMLAQQPGGPKSGGYAITGTDQSSFNRFFSPNDQDATVQKLTDGISTAFTSSLLALGGKDSTASFALGFDTDPQGTAGSRVSSAATVNGQTVYRTRDVDVGRDDKAVQAAMQTETERLLLSALQASDLPADMAAILNTVAAATASATDVANVIALAGAFKQVQDVATAMTDPLKAASNALATANQTAMDAYEAQRAAFADLVANTQPTAESLAALSSAAGDLYKSTVTLIAGMLQLKSSMSAMFADTRESIIRSLLPPDELYERIRQQTQSLFQQLATATDPAEINRITGLINANINTEWQALTPEQQKQQAPQFLAGLDAVDTLSQQRIDAAVTQVTDQASADQKVITDELDKILTEITGAAGDFKAGADGVTKAVSAGINVNVRVTDDRATAEVTG